MALLDAETSGRVKNMLADLPAAVKLIAFTDDQHCDYCTEIVQLLTEVAAASDLVSVETYEIHRDAEKARDLHVERAPVIAFVGERDYGIRFYGIPSGYEFSTLLHGIHSAGHGQAHLDASTKTYLDGLKETVDYQVFVTPTCPYCPRSATLAIEMAVHSDLVNANIVEASEFPDLANKFEVMGVPLTVINSRERVEGAAPAQMIVDAMRKAAA
jgi:glutaredoxin-like protein